MGHGARVDGHGGGGDTEGQQPGTVTKAPTEALHLCPSTIIYPELTMCQSLCDMILVFRKPTFQ